MLTGLDKRRTTAQHQGMPRKRRRPHCGPCTVVSCRKDRPSSLKKIGLELAEDLQVDREG